MELSKFNQLATVVVNLVNRIRSSCNLNCDTYLFVTTDFESLNKYVTRLACITIADIRIADQLHHSKNRRYWLYSKEDEALVTFEDYRRCVRQKIPHWNPDGWASSKLKRVNVDLDLLLAIYARGRLDAGTPQTDQVCLKLSKTYRQFLVRAFYYTVLYLVLRFEIERLEGRWSIRQFHQTLIASDPFRFKYYPILREVALTFDC